MRFGPLFFLRGLWYNMKLRAAGGVRLQEPGAKAEKGRTMNTRLLTAMVAVSCILVPGCARVSAPGAEAPREALLVAENGEPRMTIVVAAAASPSTRYAAEELQRFLSQMTGAQIPIATDDSPAGPAEILVGESRRLQDMKILIDYEALGGEGYIIRTRGPHILITGGEPRGTLYGVYGFLEEHLGCRWFTPEVSVIPEARVLAVLPIDEMRVPVLEYREPFVEECFDGDWAARNRMNGNTDRLEERHGGKVTYHGFVHTFDALLPPETFFDEHPEYYSLVDGKRLKERTQLCCTNGDVMNLVAGEVRRRMAEHPEATVFSVSQNDWYNYCQCESCTRLAETEGSQMAPVLQLVNHVARSVAADFPGKLVDTLAYQYTRKPPATLRPEPNVIIRLCSIECDFSHPFEERTTPENRAFCDDLEAWAGIANRLWIWNYNTSYSHYLVPFPNLYVRGPNIRYMIKNNVKGIFEQDVYNTPHGFLSPLSGYLGAKLLWNPGYDTDQAIDEFLKGVYGDAATPLRLYINLLHEAVRDPETRMGIWIGPDVPFLTDAIMERADMLMDAAETAVAGDPEALERVRIARLAVDYTIMERVRALNAGAFEYNHEELTVRPSSDFKARADRFFATAERHGLRAIRESGGELSVYKESIYGYLQTRTLTPVEAVPLPGQPLSGVTYSYFDRQFEALPDFDALEARAQGVAAQFNLAPAREQDSDAYALLFKGYFLAPRDGVYTFSTRSNDGSALTVGDTLVVNNDGLHQDKTVTSFIALRKGYHPIKVSFFESGGTDSLSAYFAGPEIPYQEIPTAVLFHSAE